ncbi:tyrosine-type recombinase/integrase [Bradyrhizobium pachyrhizi]|uniref:Tyrosine-type recombinase/integrase n=1 Tax=Bradyrhizobium pachyrhizi TaxID=280333 RepID=A0A844SH07_9BRAD|nr:tyrosine-type recombinase/integrase [Bradyrhizobium pachyrhizi]MVT64846.1 tyrosine-type recombinase/integrase [Bradyrhizobium pachyrhizi]
MHEVIPEYRIKIVRFESGERFPVVLDRSGLPLHRPVFFFETERHRATNTLESKARTVAMVHNFLRAYRIDLHTRVQQSRVLSMDEVSALSEHLRMIGSRTEARRVRLKLAHPEIEVPEIVAGHEWYHRRWRAYQYLAWLVASIRDEFELPGIEYAKISEELLKVRMLLVERRTPPNNPPPVALSRKQIVVLLDAICPGSSTNPFPAHLQFRNFVLIGTYWENGLRKSEVLGLKTADLSQERDPPTLKLVRRPNSSKEHRARPAAVKTMPRMVPVTPLLHGLLTDYINDARRSVEFSLRNRGDKVRLRRFRSHSFIFVSSHGAPLSSSSVHKIFHTLRMSTSGLPANLSPHALRRTWNDLFTELGQEHLGPRATQIREYLMGWVRGSRQPAHYARLSTQRAAAKAIREMQREWMARREEMEDA